MNSQTNKNRSTKLNIPSSAKNQHFPTGKIGKKMLFCAAAPYIKVVVTAGCVALILLFASLIVNKQYFAAQHQHADLSDSSAIVKIPAVSSLPIVGEPFVTYLADLHGGDSISAESRSEMLRRVDESIAQLQAQQLLPASFTAAPVQFGQPIQAANSTPGFSYYAISNYFDHDPLFTDKLQDYRCGDQTYDADDGYNHSGTDFMPFPFPWQKMDRDEVYVIAAASGVIVDKLDGRFDGECVAESRQGNTIVLQHDDGSKSWYLHMKNGSLLSKSIGDAVTIGEYLGVIGSSGRSNGPHLHFEVTDANGDTIDPFFDASTASCNTTTNESWWANQLPYDASGINDIILSAESPEFPPCQKAILAERADFAPNEQVIFNVFYRNDSANKQTNFVLYSPDGSPVVDWVHAPAVSYSAGAAWSFPLTLPSSVPLGDWRLEATYEERVYDKGFAVAASVAATPSPTATYTPVPTAAAATNTPIPTKLPATATLAPTETAMPTETAIPTETAVPTVTSSATPTPSATPVPTQTSVPTRSTSADSFTIYLPAVVD